MHGVTSLRSGVIEGMRLHLGRAALTNEARVDLGCGVDEEFGCRIWLGTRLGKVA